MLRKGQRAPEFQLRTAAGSSTSLRELTSAGSLVLFFIRATTCSFCQGELSRLALRHKEFQAAKMSLAAVVCEVHSRAAGWYEEVKPPYPLLVDEDRAVARHFGVYKALGFDSFRMAQPSVFVIDRSKVVQFARLLSEEDAVRSLDECLAVGRTLGPAGAPEAV